MKRLGTGIAIALILFFGGIGKVRAQTTTIGSGVVTDPLICPEGCTANTIIVIDGAAATLGTIYTATGTNNPLAVPGGYDASLMAAFSLAVTPTTSTNTAVGGGGVDTATIGTLGTQYADGRYAGFYLAPNGKYYPISTGSKFRGAEAACSAHGSPSGWRNESVSTDFHELRKGFIPHAICRTVLTSYTCLPLSVSGVVYYDEFGTYSTARGWDLGKLFRLRDVVFTCNLR